MIRKQLKKCPVGNKGCKQVIFYKYGACFFCSGYVGNNKYKKIDKVRLCLSKNGKRRDIYTFTPDEATAIADVLNCGVLYFLTHFKPYGKWRGWE